MADLSVTYLKLHLKNPIIIGACNLSSRPDFFEKAEKAGAAAIVYKSLFEEQIQLERFQMEEDLELYNERNAEMVKLFPSLQHAGPEEHLNGLRNAKKSIGIPLIASLNAVLEPTWIEYAREIENTGVDALELNFYAVPQDEDVQGVHVEKEQKRILDAVVKAVKIPVSVKLSPFYTNPLHLISEFDKAGAKGFILFNRLFQPEIDIDTEKHVSPWNLSSSEDHKLSLRYAGLLWGKINADICASTGIYTGHDVIRMILAGAQCVQVVSTIYVNKLDHIGKMLTEMELWMEKHKYSSLDQFRGKLSAKNINDPFVYKRAQYIDLLLNSEEIFKKYPIR